MNGCALTLTQPQFNVSHIPTHGNSAELYVLWEHALRHESVDCRSGEPRDLNDISDPENSGSTARVHTRLYVCRKGEYPRLRLFGQGEQKLFLLHTFWKISLFIKNVFDYCHAGVRRIIVLDPVFAVMGFVCGPLCRGNGFLGCGEQTILAGFVEGV